MLINTIQSVPPCHFLAGEQVPPAILIPAPLPACWELDWLPFYCLIFLPPAILILIIIINTKTPQSCSPPPKTPPPHAQVLTHCEQLDLVDDLQVVDRRGRHQPPSLDSQVRQPVSTCWCFPSCWSSTVSFPGVPLAWTCWTCPPPPWTRSPPH